MAVIGELATLITARVEPFTSGLKKAGRAADTFSSRIKGSIGPALSGLGGLLTGTAAKLTALTGGMGATGLIAYATRQAIAFEDASTAFQTFLGSGEKAKKLLTELTKFSDITPFTATEARAAGRGLLAFGFAADEIVPTLQYLGDAAAGTQSNIEDMVNILGKVRTKGRAQMEEMNRFIERGVNLMPALAKAINVSQMEVAKLVSAGKVGFDDVVKSLKMLNAEGGLFYNSMENLSKTTSGRLSTLKSAFDALMKDVGTSFLEGLNLKQLTEQLTSMVGVYRQDIVDATVQGVLMIKSAMKQGKEAASWLQEQMALWNDLAMAIQIRKNNMAIGWQQIKSAPSRVDAWVSDMLGMPGQNRAARAGAAAADERIRVLRRQNENMRKFPITPDVKFQWEREKEWLDLQRKELKALEKLGEDANRTIILNTV